MVSAEHWLKTLSKAVPTWTAIYRVGQVIAGTAADGMGSVTDEEVSDLALVGEKATCRSINWLNRYGWLEGDRRTLRLPDSLRPQGER